MCGRFALYSDQKILAWRLRVWSSYGQLQSVNNVLQMSFETLERVIQRHAQGGKKQCKERAFLFSGNWSYLIRFNVIVTLLGVVLVTRNP